MGTKDQILSGEAPRVVDRHNEVIDVTAQEDLVLRGGPLTVKVTGTLARLLDLDGGMITIPMEWVAGVRRDEIRLSLAVHDPAFKARIPEQTPGTSPPPVTADGPPNISRNLPWARQRTVPGGGPSG